MARLLQKDAFVAEYGGPGSQPGCVVSPPLRRFSAPRAPRASGEEQTDAGGNSLVLTGARVLIVEDDDDARALFAAMLENAGCVVTTACSVAEAFEVMEHAQPQVIISDIGMPHEDGLSFMRRVRARSEAEGGAIPSIALTAYTGAVERRHALQAGFNTYLSKPVRMEELLSALRNLTVDDPS